MTGPDTPAGKNGRPGPSEAPLRAVVVGALLAIAGGLLLDAPVAITSDQRVIVAGVSILLAAILGIARPGYLRRG